MYIMLPNVFLKKGKMCVTISVCTCIEYLWKVKEKLNGYEKVLKLKEKNTELLSVAHSLSAKDQDLSKKILDIIGK